MRAGSTRVYVFVVRVLRPPPWPSTFVVVMRLRATVRVPRRHVINPRNEGVRGSNPRVGSQGRTDQLSRLPSGRRQEACRSSLRNVTRIHRCFLIALEEGEVRREAEDAIALATGHFRQEPEMAKPLDELVRRRE